MSVFGQPQGQQSGGLFGGQQTSSAFGGIAAQPQQQQQGSMFGNLGGQPKPQQSGGLFGNLGGSTQQQQQPTGLFGSVNQSQPQQNQQGGGLFGNSMNQQQQGQQGGGLFGNSTNQQQQQQSQQGGGLFQNSQQQQQQPQGSLFGNSAQRQPGLSMLGQTNTPSREKSIPEQMATVFEKWHPDSQNCVFQHYFYNKVDPDAVPHYLPGPGEDPKAWEEALGKKPGPGYIPVLCTGFTQLGERIKVQAVNLSLYNQALHRINGSLSKMLQDHETKHSIRALDAKRKHAVLRQRCLRIATKVQVLRSRGYALGGDEEDLRTKLQELEKKANDPGLGARAEEIWARMLAVQERAKVLKSEIERSGGEAQDMLDEETTKKAKKILEDYDRQLVHLKKELDAIHREYVEWEKTQTADAEARAAASVRPNIR